MASPHALTVFEGYRRKHATGDRIVLNHGRFPIPSLTTLLAPCQAQIQVVLSRSTEPLGIRAVANGFYLKTVETEGAAMWFTLKEKHTILLITQDSFYGNSHTTMDSSTWYLAGGNIMWTLLYSSSGSGHLTVQSGHLACYSCLRTHHHFFYSGVWTCLYRMEHAYRLMTEGGRRIRWFFRTRSQTHSSRLPDDPSHQNCFFSRTSGSCQNFEPKHVLLNHLVEALNRSAVQVTMTTVQSSELNPTISWSEDDTDIEIDALIHIFPLQIFPVFNSNKSKSILRFITSDGVYQTVPSLYMYIQPLRRGSRNCSRGCYATCFC